ncbi:MAG TPA: amidophosphoribosyltransferase [Candidatus Fraserbacteria bacterium]|nr:amidophosphoribosyltransferase [Candidatus Fraserbacteria bacterium]
MSLHEACGLFGICSTEDKIAESLHLGLFTLQHRGQEAAGFALARGGEFFLYKDLGSVEEVYRQGNVRLRRGQLGIAHTRYSTAGESAAENAQPIGLHRQGRWLALTHNGTVANAARLRRELSEQGVVFQGSSDTEILLQLYARAPEGTSPEERLARLAGQVRGAYSLLLLDGDRLIAARDPFGFRPLVIGRRGADWLIASETAALEMVGARPEREVRPGEAVIFRPGREPEARRFAPERAIRCCVFELIYFGRPDSVIFDHDVYQFRKRTGCLLARKEGSAIDLVVPVPDSGVPAALGYAQALDCPLELGLIRSHYVGRSFIEPQQASRLQVVKMKLLPLRSVLSGRRVALVDDSIVRGTTAKAVVELVREFGAAEVHLRIASPPIIAPCFFGIDMPTKAELLASGRTLADIKEFLQADSINYLTLAELAEATGVGAGLVPALGGFCDACFSGCYPAGSLAEDDLFRGATCRTPTCKTR